MKPIAFLIIAVLLACNFVLAQDTLYIYKAGSVVSKRAVTNIDSITFHKEFTAVPQNTITDIDGNVYHTVTIGTQTWMVENLKTTRYRNGNAIPVVSDATAWSNLTTGAYCNNSNEANNAQIYGRLYNWYAVNDSRNIAPVGWHIPTDAEWSVLSDYLADNGYGYGGSRYAIAKAMSETSGWTFSTVKGAVGNEQTENNSVGFKGISGGFRLYNGTYELFGRIGIWWSLTVIDGMIWYRDLNYDYAILERGYASPACGFSVRCIKDENSTTIVLPTLSTFDASSIETTSATSGGTITSDGGATVTERGVCWNITGSPTKANSKTNNGSGIGSFTSDLTNLTENTTYYVRAYATNSAGTAYGAEISFTTKQATNNGTVTDIDGNIYHTVTIGTQTWLLENLKTTKYRNGDVIPNVIINSSWGSLSTGAYCNYGNDANNATTYGRLYNWYAVTDTRNIAPTGWHVPTVAEWNTLITYLTNNGYGYGGSGDDIGKSIASTSGWTVYSSAGTVGNNQTANNGSGFTGLPGGYRSNSGTFGLQGLLGAWWCTTNEFMSLYNNYTNLIKDYASYASGYSVRCIKGEGTPVIVVLPTVTTLAVSNVTASSATCGGVVTNDGGGDVTARGVCWNTTGSPTINNSKTSDGTGPGSFVSNITNLSANTHYYVRAYATNSIGTAYGSEVNFTTQQTSEGTVTDIDGNVYHTVTIGTQTWLLENLKTTKYRNGDAIPNVADNNQWYSLSTGAYCNHSNNANNSATYGRLYNWFAVNDTRKIAPTGWRLPTIEEWTVLKDYLTNNGYGYGGSGADIGKSLASKTGWTSSTVDGSPGNNPSGNNSSGFTALPCGGRNNSGPFIYNIGEYSYWWSSTENNSNSAKTLNIINDAGYSYLSTQYKNAGLSVRCIKE